MTELHIPTLRQIAKAQFKKSGKISPEILDAVIEEWSIEFDQYKDPVRAQDMWRNLISLYLVSPKTYERTCGYIEGTHAALVARKERGDDIPDIVA